VGNVTENRAPFEEELFSAQMLPPCASTMDLEMIKPIPIPAFFVVSICSNRWRR
jgi:hypothetical protein